ncbi:hypothetical protein, partial [Stenotrophomonas maltophilia]|uniref:hypothetical protein n=1 Tax=Stenotrophomonas maltophilia TaxID=40324 RepID=UPI00314569F3
PRIGCALSVPLSFCLRRCLGLLFSRIKISLWVWWFCVVFVVFLVLDLEKFFICFMFLNHRVDLAAEAIFSSALVILQDLAD